jgi:hypothetical protein
VTWCMRIACWVTRATHTLRLCNNHCCTAATLAARTYLHYMLRTFPLLLFIILLLISLFFRKSKNLSEDLRCLNEIIFGVSLYFLSVNILKLSVTAICDFRLHVFKSFGQAVTRFHEVLQRPPKLRSLRNTRRDSIHSYVDFTISFATVN